MKSVVQAKIISRRQDLALINEKLKGNSDALDANKRRGASFDENERLYDLLRAAYMRRDAVEAKLKNSPTPEDYFEDFSPAAIQKTLSDADGKFSFAYPRGKALAIYASAQRAVLNKTEKYYWLVNAPTNAETSQLFLSNNNLVFADPDDYLKIKPIQQRYDSW